MGFVYRHSPVYLENPVKSSLLDCLNKSDNDNKGATPRSLTHYVGLIPRGLPRFHLKIWFRYPVACCGEDSFGI